VFFFEKSIGLPENIVKSASCSVVKLQYPYGEIGSWRKLKLKYPSSEIVKKLNGINVPSGNWNSLNIEHLNENEKKLFFKKK
jgi:hypothetical protein